MRYLREGLVCGGSVEDGFELLDLRTGRGVPLEPGEAEVARRLARGLEGSEAERAASRLGPELVEEREEPFDRVLGAMLSRLDAGFAWALPEGGRRLVALAELAHSALRHVRPDLDQHHALPETAARRALELLARAGPGGRVVLVGDDDLVSLPAAALGLEVTALDLDRDLLELVDLLSARLGLRVATREVDLREPLAGELRGAFDAFCADPETTRECVSLFLSRGASMVRPGGFGLLCCAEEFVGLADEALAASGLSTLARLRRFSSYRTSSVELSHYRSDLLVVGVAAGSRPVVAADERFEGDLFPFDLHGGEHLLVTALGCDPAATAGEGLLRLVESLVAGEGVAPRAVDSRPMPVRVVRAASQTASAQATVHSDRTTVELDLGPAPETDAIASAVASRMKDLLGAAELRARVLRRAE